MTLRILICFVLIFSIGGAPSFAYEMKDIDEFEAQFEWTEAEVLIKHPSLSSYCQEVLTRHLDKKKFKVRLLSLLKRTKLIMSEVPLNKVTIRKKLESRYFQIHRLLKLTELQITNTEESIIREGCPGLFITKDL